MLLTNEFVVARPIDETWAVLTDIERIAPCMPGAQLTGVSGDEYQGKVKVKVGPMTAQFSGTAVFKEQDAAAHRAVIEAKGRDASGKGRASALVTAVLVAEEATTRVQVATDLNIAGPLAQMGRSTIADISTRLLTQFVENLEQQLAVESTADPVAESPEAVEPSAPAPAPAPEPEAVDLTKIAGTGTLLKLALPVVVVIAAIVAVVVWVI
jgi:carbon monoxide dehydrogenase subunit G